MGKENKKKIAVAILPWANLKEDIQVGPVTFWPWSSSKIQDEDIKKQLERFFNIFVDRYGKPINTITICSHRNPDFRVLEEQEYKELQAAINILTFCSICREVKRAVCSNNNSIAPPNAEYFDFFGQKFTIPDDNSIVIGTRNSMSWDSLDKIHISTPWGVFGFGGTSPDKGLVRAFNKIFKEDISAEIKERIFRSLEWFKFAHTEANNVSEASRLVMMSTAFEILLDFPDKQKSIYFSNEIEKKLKKDKSIPETRVYKKKSYNYIKAACWAYDFYQLRNKIVHGGQFLPENEYYKGWITYSIVADLVFWELLVKKLFEYNCFAKVAEERAEDYPYYAKDDNNFDEFILHLTMGFDDYHRALGWVEPLKNSSQINELL